MVSLKKSAPAHAVNENLRLREYFVQMLVDFPVEFSTIDLNDFLFIKDPVPGKNKHDEFLEIVLPDRQLGFAMPSVRFVVIAHDRINNLNPAEVQRQIFHVLLHVPKDYKDLDNVQLRDHDFEDFERVSLKFKRKIIEDTEKKLISMETLP